MHGSENNWLIKKAQVSHVPEIYAIARSYDCNRLLQTNDLQDGFLVSAYSEELYLRFVTESDHFYVALQDDVVIGFQLAFSRDLIPEIDWVGTQMKSRDPRDFILIKQAAAQRNYLGKGVAMLLYQHLSDYYKQHPLVSAIVIDPPNPRSVGFHKKLGFDKVWEITPPDGIPRVVMCREPSV